MDPEEHGVYEFGPFRLDVQERLLRRNGKTLPLESSQFQVLAVLVREAGHLVTRERLLQSVWNGIHVEEGSLTVTISVIRKALGDSPSEPKYIETVRKAGYRFIAAVTEIRRPGTAPAPPGPSELQQQGSGPLRQRPFTLWTRAALGSMTVLILTVAGWFSSSTRVMPQPTTTTIANSVREFACTQGQDNWYYGYYSHPFTSASFKEMTLCLSNDPWYGGNAWWIDPQRYWTSLRAAIAFPNGPTSCRRENVEHWAVRRWVSEVDGTVRISGTIRNVLGGFDGFTVHIQVDDGPHWSQAITGTQQVEYTLDVRVQLGSAVDFAVQPQTSDCNDHASFTATITGLLMS